MSAATILFAGTPEFARASLCAMVDAGFVPAVVLTQPDRRAGRGRKMTASPVKRYAESLDIEVWQPPVLKGVDLSERIAALKPDLIVVAAYGLILPRALLDIPRRGCLNVHASLLPRWRGAAPIQQAILSGDTETGVCLMDMEAGLDNGGVYARMATSIGAAETAGELHDRLCVMGGQLLERNLDDILAARIVAVPQDHAAATYAGKIRREDAAIDWNLGADAVYRGIRAYNPVPGAYFELDGESIKVWRAELAGVTDTAAGTILSADKTGVVVACGTGALRLTELQRPGRNRLAGSEFAAQAGLVGRQLR